MKKTKIQNIILYITNFILIGVILLSNKDFILNNNKIILKNMSESTQVTDLNKSINELEASHEEYQNYIQTKKTDLATALTNAGVSTSGNDTFETITTNVSKILANKTNDATAVVGEILAGKTAYVKGNKIIGTMKDNKAVSPTALNAGGSYTIPAGYHNGSGKVTANTLANQTKATATADNITSGKTAWVNGKLITGNSLNREHSEILALLYGSTYTFSSNYDKVYCVAFQGSDATPAYSGNGVFTEINKKQFSHFVGLYKIENVKANDTLHGYGYAIVFK